MKGSLQSFGVIVGFTVLKNSLDYLKRLSAKLQRYIDVFQAYAMIDNIKSEIQFLRDDIGVPIPTTFINFKTEMWINHDIMANDHVFMKLTKCLQTRMCFQTSVYCTKIYISRDE